MAVPRTVTEARREANERMPSLIRGFREIQVRSFIRSRIESGEPWPTHGEVMRELDFYDRAGAYRVTKRLKDKGAL